MTEREPTPSILVSYDNQPAALVNARHVTFVCDELPAGHPRLRMLIYMARYAQLIADGERPGPYSDEDAQRFARAALIDAAQLRAHRDESDEQLAARFNLPLEQIPAARRDLATAGGPRGMPSG
jgi:hypothetical protein